MAIWVDRNENKPAGPFDGVLIVLNVGVENFKSLPKEFLQSVRDAVGDAHAAGWLVLYLFDSAIGAQPPPEEFDNIEGFDFYRNMHDVWGRNVADFEPLPDKRMKEFVSLAESVREYKGFVVQGKAAKIVGQCSIAGSKTLMPVVEIK